MTPTLTLTPQEHPNHVAAPHHIMGEILREARLDKGMTLRDVVDISFVSLAMLSELERGVKEASSLIVAQVAGALDIPLSKLYLDTARELHRLGQ